MLLLGSCRCMWAFRRAFTCISYSLVRNGHNEWRGVRRKRLPYGSEPVKVVLRQPCAGLVSVWGEDVFSDNINDYQETEFTILSSKALFHLWRNIAEMHGGKTHQGIFNKKPMSDLKSMSQKLLEAGRGHLGKYCLFSYYSLLHCIIYHRG